MSAAGAHGLQMAPGVGGCGGSLFCSLKLDWEGANGCRRAGDGRAGDGNRGKSKKLWPEGRRDSHITEEPKRS